MYPTAALATRCVLIPERFTQDPTYPCPFSNSHVRPQWFKFNDHKVELAPVSEVLGAQAYLLFYIIRSLA